MKKIKEPTTADVPSQPADAASITSDDFSKDVKTVGHHRRNVWWRRLQPSRVGPTAAPLQEENLVTNLKIEKKTRRHEASRKKGRRGPASPLLAIVLLVAITCAMAYGRPADTNQVWTIPAASVARGDARGRRPKPKGNSDGEAEARKKQRRLAMKVIERGFDGDNTAAVEVAHKWPIDAMLFHVAGRLGSSVHKIQSALLAIDRRGFDTDPNPPVLNEMEDRTTENANVEVTISMPKSLHAMYATMADRCERPLPHVLVRALARYVQDPAYLVAESQLPYFRFESDWFWREDDDLQEFLQVILNNAVFAFAMEKLLGDPRRARTSARAALENALHLTPRERTELLAVAIEKAQEAVVIAQGWLRWAPSRSEATGVSAPADSGDGMDRQDLDRELGAQLDSGLPVVMKAVILMGHVVRNQFDGVFELAARDPTRLAEAIREALEGRPSPAVEEIWAVVVSLFASKHLALPSKIPAGTPSDDTMGGSETQEKST